MRIAVRSRADRHAVARLRGIAPALVAVALLAGIPAPAHGQERVPAAVALGLGAKTVRPLGEPHLLVIGGAPKFRFAIELANVGQPPPGLPVRALAEGSGSAVRGPRSTFWQLRFERLTIDRQTFAAVSAFATLDVTVNNATPSRRAYTADYVGLDGSPYGGAGSPLRNLMMQFVTAAAHGVVTPPNQPVGDRSALYDVGEAVRQTVARVIANAQLVQPIAPAAVAGAIDYRERMTILAGLADRAVLRTAYGDVALRVEASAVIDRATALPLLSRLRAFGPVETGVFRGPVDMTITTVLALEGMGDPAQALPPAPQIVIAPTVAPTPPVPGPPAETVTAPPKPRPPAKPPAAKPAATPKPQPPPPPAEKPAEPKSTDDVARRLEQLKGLFDRGLITKEQYETKQKEILGTL